MSFAEAFDWVCPYYLSIGMTYDQFWYGDPCMVRAFRRADKMRWENLNAQAWLQGKYNFAAVSLAMSNAFSKGNRKDYLSKPFELSGRDEDKTEEELELEREQAKDEVRRQLRRMVAQQQRNKQNG